MKRIAIFVEGQSELIFIRNLLLVIIDNLKLSFECLKLHGEKQEPAPYKYSPPTAAVYFLIINVGGDTKVGSAIKEKGKKLFDSGYDEIIGLRDMYCEAYQKRSPDNIDDKLSQSLIEGVNKIIQTLVNAEKITIYFSIMEIESWILSNV